MLGTLCAIEGKWTAVCTYVMHTNISLIGPGTYVYIYTLYRAQWPLKTYYTIYATICAGIKSYYVHITHVVNEWGLRPPQQYTLLDGQFLGKRPNS